MATVLSPRTRPGGFFLFLLLSIHKPSNVTQLGRAQVPGRLLPPGSAAVVRQIDLTLFCRQTERKSLCIKHFESLNVFSHLPAAYCPEISFKRNAVANRFVVGRTGDTITKICDDGFSISDANQIYSCVGTSPGISAWSPTVQATNCVGKG